MYKRQPTHLAPEATRFNPQGAQGQDMFLASRYHLASTFCTVPVLETDGCFSKSGCPNHDNFTVQTERSNHDQTAIEPRENDPGEASLAPLELPLAPFSQEPRSGLADDGGNMGKFCPKNGQALWEQCHFYQP